MGHSRIQDAISLIAEGRAIDVERKLLAIIFPLLGDRASEFKDLIGKKDLAGLKQFLAEQDITIAASFGRLAPRGVYGEGYKPIDKNYTVYKGSSMVGSFQEAW